MQTRFPIAATRNLLYNLVRRDLTVRYKDTVLGFFWSFIKPLAMTGIFYAVFQLILGVHLRPSEARIPFALHMLTGMLAWNFFAGATAESMHVIVANANLIKKVRLPLAVFPAATVISHLVHFLLAMIVLVALLILAGLPPTISYAWLVPLVALQCVLTLAVAMALSALNVFYRDVGSIWEVLTQAWFYATPVIYPAWMVTDKIQKLGWPRWIKYLYLCNPLAPLVLAYRKIFLYDSAPGAAPEITGLGASLALCTVVSFALLAVSWRVFRHYARAFADEL